GVREKRNSFLTVIDRCLVLDTSIGERIVPLRELLYSMDAYARITQVEVACVDDAAALVFSNIDDLSSRVRINLIAFGQNQDLHIYLQPKGPDTVHRIWPESAGRHQERLSYLLDAFDLSMTFHPMDFTQVNAGINRDMVSTAVEW